ncbi:FAD-dependent oxidoreductase [Acrocarpospora catenulata]|uniref:FAD-dependent oxidoreductase n=1 Tax=Acrocarpospora catenulata TaxID=2836182 RepID=UPI001BDAD441|nr:FAD-dependent oxidoreductase [Acrocarpospora catenulata]
MTDLVVAGGGLAGHAAALAAAELGADVVLLEKTEHFGGSSAMAGGGLVFAGTELQRREGVDDSPERLRAALAEAGRGRSDPALLDAYVDTQLAVHDWLRALGAEFSLTGQPVRRLHTMPSGALVGLLNSRALDHPSVDYRTRSRVVSLLHTSDGVTGVVVDGGRRITARYGVVLASGGFSRNPELVARFAPQCAQAVAMGGAGNDGDGLLLALAAGGALAGMEFVEASFGASAAEGVEPRLLYAQSDGAVVVNTLGRRFADEGADIKTLGRAVAEQPGALAFQVFDQAVMAKSRPTPKPRDFAAAARDGLLVQAPTLPELAARMGVPADALAESARELSRPPYYSYACKAGLTSTYGGLRVDGTMRVLDAEGAPIHGLRAAGELVGGFHGAGYLIGSALGKAAVFGYLAGRGAVPAAGEAARNVPVS